MCRPSPAINKRRRVTHQWILFMTESWDVTLKTTEHNLIIHIGKSEAEITNSKRLHSRHCTVEAIEREARSMARPLSDNRATCWRTWPTSDRSLSIAMSKRRSFCRLMLCKRGLCRHALSVCPSVRPSVCHVREICRKEYIFSIFFHRRVATSF